MKPYFFILSIAIYVLLTACATKTAAAPQHRTDIKTIVNDSETALVDVRIPSEYNAATAKNAVNIPLAEIENNLDFFRKQKKIVVFCNRGRQAKEAIEILNKHGITNVENGVTWQNVKAIQDEK